jgi:hypothetical protein
MPSRTRTPAPTSLFLIFTEFADQFYAALSNYPPPFSPNSSAVPSGLSLPRSSRQPIIPPFSSRSSRCDSPPRRFSERLRSVAYLGFSVRGCPVPPHCPVGHPFRYRARPFARLGRRVPRPEAGRSLRCRLCSRILLEQRARGPNGRGCFSSLGL